MGTKAPYLYYAEYWGDYSLTYPIRGTWERTPKAALASLDSKIKASALR